MHTNTHNNQRPKCDEGNIVGNGGDGDNGKGNGNGNTTSAFGY